MKHRPASSIYLAAYTHEIASFIGDDGDDLHSLRCVSRLLSITTTSCRRSLIERERRARQLASFVGRPHALLANDLKLLLQTPGSHASKRGRRSSSKLSDAQLQPLLRDLVLVGLGVRASCLVDTCQLSEDTIQSLLLAFAVSSHWRAYGLHQLRAIRLAGNVFFVNVHEFVRLKTRELATELQSVGLIDASAALETPRAIGMVGSTRQALVASLQEILDKLIGSVRDPSVVIGVTSTNATALAGIVLCYPVVYHVDSGASLDAANGVSDGVDSALWASSENSLSMRPLYLLQTSITVRHQGAINKFPLLEFSVPQQFTDDVGVVPHLKTIMSRLERSLELSIGHMSDAIDVQVELTARTLSHVAL